MNFAIRRVHLHDSFVQMLRARDSRWLLWSLLFALGCVG